MSKSKNKILTELPRYTEGTYKGRVNYQVMEGMDLELLYNEIIERLLKNNDNQKLSYLIITDKFSIEIIT